MKKRATIVKHFDNSGEPTGLDNYHLHLSAPSHRTGVGKQPTIEPNCSMDMVATATEEENERIPSRWQQNVRRDETENSPKIVKLVATHSLLFSKLELVYDKIFKMTTA